eukprot:jgi/Chrzof1/2719/Cz11g26130.t1
MQTPAVCWALCFLLFAVTASTAPVSQVDVCNLHKPVAGGVAPMTVTVFQGICTVSGLTMPSNNASCSVSKNDAALVFKFPCKESSIRSLPKVNGPALNLWSSMSGQAASNKRGAGAISQTCNITTLSPTLYFHSVPPLYSYGFSVDKIPCAYQAATAFARMAATPTSSSMQYGFWLVPAIKVSKTSEAKAAQMCQLVVTSAKTYVSVNKYPCKLMDQPTALLGKGCCYDPGL